MTKLKTFIIKHRLVFLYIPMILFDFVLLSFAKTIDLDSREDFIFSAFCIFFFLFGFLFKTVLKDYIYVFKWLKQHIIGKI